MKLNRLPTLIFIAMLLGVLVGTAAHNMAPDAATAKSIADHLSILTDVFLRMIKMIIGPLVFATLVAGIASMGDGRAVGRIGLKAMMWFIGASITSLLLGLVMANLLEPGHGMNLPLPPADAASNLKTGALNLRDFIAHMFPKSFVEAMAHNEILQIVVFSLFFGFALGTVKDGVGKPVLQGIEGLATVMLKVTNYVMAFAPVGVFGAIAAVITAQGLGVLVVYAKLIGSLYLALALLWVALIAGGYFFLGRDVFRLLKQMRAPLMIGFATASSESAYPKVIDQLTRFGVKERITNFVLPLGYSFNLDGSIMYTSFAALFVAQVYGIELSLTQQITMLLVLLVTSKGIAGVPRASLVVVAAVLPMFGLPEAGILLVLGIDHVLDMGRTVTNVLGNAIATAVVAKSEDAIGAPVLSDEDEPVVADTTTSLASAQAMAGKKHSLPGVPGPGCRYGNRAFLHSGAAPPPWCGKSRHPRRPLPLWSARRLCHLPHPTPDDRSATPSRRYHPRHRTRVRRTHRLAPAPRPARPCAAARAAGAGHAGGPGGLARLPLQLRHRAGAPGRTRPGAVAAVHAGTGKRAGALRLRARPAVAGRAHRRAAAAPGRRRPRGTRQ